MSQTIASSLVGRWIAGLRTAPSAQMQQMRSLLAANYRERREASPSILHQIFGSRIFWRRAVLILMLMLLAASAAVRLDSMQEEALRAKHEAEDRLRLISNIAALRLAEMPSLDEALASPVLAQIFLEDAVPRRVLGGGYRVKLFKPGGTLLASIPARDLPLERQLRDFVGVDAAAPSGEGSMPAFDQVLEIPGAKSEGRRNDRFAHLSPVRGTGASTRAIVLTFIERPDVFADWRALSRQDLVLFAGLSAALLVFFYAYMKQSVRVNETDQLFDDTTSRFDTALSRGFCGLWDWDLSRGRIVWSTSMYEMLGMKPTGARLRYGAIERLLHPEEPDLVGLANDTFASGDKHIDHRFRMLHASGSWVWLRIRAELLYYKDGSPHLIGIAVDVSEQETLRAKNRDADIRLRDAIENISEAFVLWDSRKRLVMCNTKYQQLYQLPRRAVAAGTSYEALMAQGRKPALSHRISTDRKSEPGSNTFEARLEDGRWMQISERRTRDGGFVSVGTDITQIKRNEEKLLHSESQLKATVESQRKTQQKTELQAQRLVELAEKYNEEKIRAEEANVAKSDFLANISHELRTPLNAIIGFSDIMKSQLFGPIGTEKYGEYSKDIYDSGNFLLGVINDILDMSKIEAGRLQLHAEPIRLHEVLEESLRIIALQAKDAGLSVEHSIPERLEIEADKRAVKQILLNLLSNAVKFTPEGGTIKVKASLVKGHARIVIEDDGVGISKQALKRIGQPFEQVQDQFTKNHKGSGLGLAIAKSLAALHGGTLKIRSSIGKGTTVVVRLPRHDQIKQVEAGDDIGRDRL